MAQDNQYSTPVYQTELSMHEFNKLSKFIMNEYGIKMPPEKKIMLQSRLQKRLRALNISTFTKYVDYVFSPDGQSEEVIHMMDVVSTNKTDFFRESAHFDYLLSHTLPEFILKKRLNNIKVWSAGCSSGEEPYTIAITLSEFKEKNPVFDFTLTASDISSKMLKNAVTAVYSNEKISEIPKTILKKYFLRSKNRQKSKVKIVKSIRSKVNFFRQNLLYLPYVQNPDYNIIFCRNVLIYFDRTNQYNILQKLCMDLKPGGYLFLGHSESIAGFDLPVEHIKPTIFRKI